MTGAAGFIGFHLSKKLLLDGSIVTGGGKDRKLVLFDATYRRNGAEAEVNMTSHEN